MLRTIPCTVWQMVQFCLQHAERMRERRAQERKAGPAPPQDIDELDAVPVPQPGPTWSHIGDEKDFGLGGRDCLFKRLAFTSLLTFPKSWPVFPVGMGKSAGRGIPHGHFARFWPVLPYACCV